MKIRIDTPLDIIKNDLKRHAISKCLKVAYSKYNPFNGPRKYAFIIFLNERKCNASITLA